ncbi:hypothetical protein GPECTOR_30g251 [Gonium pectorale]|uniref:F-box domain-containing protein n=1 Tax=Gonium pectorale TaxID=33097 RepID=A0A150GF05_GONPE|nr:hypothetical protein GPECTOR_30g251 [Gonium pectorale]|eukprot:KXZ48155.1 hypothetical protein GPECTOR_30g251 [Gonium pectorale]
MGSGGGAAPPLPAAASPPLRQAAGEQALHPRPPMTPRPPAAAPPGTAVAGSPGHGWPRGPRSLREAGGANGTAVGGGGGGSGGGSILDRLSPPTPPPAAPPAQRPGLAAPAAEPPTRSAAAAAPDRTAATLDPPAPSTPNSTSAAAGGGAAPWPWAQALTLDAAAAAAAASGSRGACRGFADLPPELLLEVLKALPARSLAAASLVCRAWRRAAREPWLWVRQLCAAGYPLPVAAYITSASATAVPTSPTVPVAGRDPGAAASTEEAVDAAAEAAEAGAEGGGPDAARAVAGVRGIRAVRAVRAAGGSSHEDFLGGLRAGFLDRLQQQAATAAGSAGGGATAALRLSAPAAAAAAGGGGHRHHQPPTAVDLKALYGRTIQIESNWRAARYAESSLREHGSNVECLAFQDVEPWGSVLLSAAWDGGVRLFALGPPGGPPQQARCVRRYRGHTGWVTCMAAGRHQVVTASTDRRVAAWRYHVESTDPWVTLEHPQEVTLVRFAYAPPPPATTHYLPHHHCHSPAAPRAAGPALSRAGGAAAAASAPTDDRGCMEPPCTHVRQSHGSVYGADDALAAQWPYDPSYEDWVVTGCVDGALRLWHLPSKQLLRLFAGHSDVVWGAHVLHGGSVLVSAGRDGTAKLWQLPHLSEAAADCDASRIGGGGAGAGGGGFGGGGGGGEVGFGGWGAAGGQAGQGFKTVEPMATLCGHTSAVLCMDVHRAPPGVVPPAQAQCAAGAPSVPGVSFGGGGGGGGDGRPAESRAVHAEMTSTLARLLSTSLVAPPSSSGLLASGGSAGGGRAGSSGLLGARWPEPPMPLPPSPSAAAAGAAAEAPVWLVATGGADAVVRVWDLSSARCLSTLRGHTVGVLSLRFGHLPRHPDGRRDGALLPPDLDVSGAAPPPSRPDLALPPGLYGSTAGGAPGALPPSQRLVLVSGSVRDVRVWDPLSGAALAVLSDHSGPVTALALVHGALVTLAMNDGLIVYKCNGLDTPGGEAEAAKAAAAATGGASDAAGSGDYDIGDGDGNSRNGTGAGGGGGGGGLPAPVRLRRLVASQRSPLELVVCMQDAPHHSFAAALAAHLEGLAVGSGTGDITYLDFRPRPAPLPRALRPQQPQQPQPGGGSPFTLRF